MISIDYSIIAAIVIFLLLIAALNWLLFRPLAQIQAERASRTTGLMKLAQEKLNRQLALFNEYQAFIKNARMEGYRRQEQVRAEAMKKRAEVLSQARVTEEQMIQDARESIRSQAAAAKQQLTVDAGELAHSIAAAILGRSASGVSSS